MHFSVIQASELILEARTQCRKNKSLRLGQALWNLLPEEVVDLYTGGVLDFFYVEDEQSVENIFYKHFVNY